MLILSVSSISTLTLCRNVSKVPLPVNLSGPEVNFCLHIKGSLDSLSCICGVVVVYSSYITFNLCIKFLISEYKACIGNFLDFGMNFNPFLSTSFCVLVRVVCLAIDGLASMTKASLVLLFVLLSMS